MRNRHHVVDVHDVKSLQQFLLDLSIFYLINNAQGIRPTDVNFIEIIPFGAVPGIYSILLRKQPWQFFLVYPNLWMRAM